MKKIILLFLIVMTLIVLNAKTEVTTQSGNTIHIKWTMPEWQLSKQGDYVYINAVGLATSTETGAPFIPFDESKVAIPFSGTISVSITKQESKDIILEKRLQPIPKIVRGSETDVYLYVPDEKLYAASNQNLITVLSAQRFRKLSFIPIQINPFIYDGKNNLKAYRVIEFTVTIDGDVSQKSNQPLDDLTALMATQLINPVQASDWQVSERPLVNYADFNSSDHWVRIETDKDGMFKISQSQLSMFPVSDIDPRTLKLYTTGGEVQPDYPNFNGPLFAEVPIYVSGESDGNFDSSDYILFYGRDRDGLEMNQNIAGSQYMNPYSKNVCYWLTFGGSVSERRIKMANALTTWSTTATTSPETVRIENEIYQRRPLGFDWYMGKFFGNSSAEYGPYSIDLEDIETSQPQTLTIGMLQEFIEKGSTLIHKVRLKVNNTQLLTTQGQIQEWSWTGLNPVTISHTGQTFTNGTNNILINLLRSRADNQFFNYYQVAYQKKLIKRAKQYMISVTSSLDSQTIKYDFTGSNTNVRVFKAVVTSGSYEINEIPLSTVEGGFSFINSGNTITRYIVAQPSDFYAPAIIQDESPIDLTQETQSYDNLIITPSDFSQQAHSLISLYSQKWHKKSKVVLLQDIFNQFNGGMPDPGAIRLFLKHCVGNYPEPAITTVTLLGSGTCDWRNNSGQSAAKNKFIVFQKDTSTSDDFFGMLNTIQYPELAIGRYPVKTQNEMNIMLSNLDNYINNPQPGIWNNSLVFLSDDEYNGDTPIEYSHSEQLQATSRLINRSVLIDKIFAIDYDFDEFQNKPQAREDMFKAINDGKLIWYYIGHGSFDTLGAEDYFKGSSDMSRFNNPGKLPLFIAASCDVAQYDSFSFDCAAEKVLFADDRGAIASIAATRECNGSSNVALIQHYFNYSLNLRNPVGYSLLMAKTVYNEYNANDEKYNLLGDPLLLVTTPERDSTLTITTPAKDGIFNSREQVSFHGEFSQSGINDTTQVLVYGTELLKKMPNDSTYSFRGKLIYNGNSSVTNSQYNAGFIVPDDVSNGPSGFIIAYLWDSTVQKSYVNYLSYVTFNNQAVVADSIDVPEIKLYIDSMEFQTGDLVGSNPTLIAKISDRNGINITNAPGHGIMLIFDQTVSITNVTSYFIYDTDSYTSGTIQYPLTGLSNGPHTLQLIAFDNFNNPSVATTNFVISKSNAFSIKEFMPYPNPMKKDGYFTFVLSEAADVKLTLYTIRGRKIKTITSSAAKGYNQIFWDGKDADGDFLANNTYFIKITAKSLTEKAKAEKTEKLVIYN